MIKKVEDILIKLSKAESEKLKIKRDDIHIYRKDKKVENPNRPFQIGIINKGGQG